ncbi:MAG TPA: accessory factor UbiK family protein [Burkholderiales bacterium]|jgi:ubiquinone biosynthesis accessory factor UbiK|nr:accessory factor UbiK family protein [Burkholderiales bacterium]
MLSPKMLDEMSKKLSEVVAQSPVKDIEKNARALLASLFARLDLITREEFEVQQNVLKRTREKLTEMEKRVAELERALTQKNNRQG